MRTRVTGTVTRVPPLSSESSRHRFLTREGQSLPARRMDSERKRVSGHPQQRKETIPGETLQGRQRTVQMGIGNVPTSGGGREGVGGEEERDVPRSTRTSTCGDRRTGVRRTGVWGGILHPWDLPLSGRVRVPVPPSLEEPRLTGFEPDLPSPRVPPV